MRKFNKTLLATLLTTFVAGVNAASFQLAEVSSSGLGMAYAGNAAVADNASVVANNPALMTKFDRTQISAGAVVVDADVIVRGKVGGTFDAYESNVVPSKAIPNLYVVAPISERFAIGGGLNVNYGLKSQYDDNFAAGFFGGTTELTALNFNVSAAYRFDNGISLGLGFNAIHSDAEIKRTLGVAGLSAAQQAGQAAQQYATAAQQYAAAGNAQAAQAAQAAAAQYASAAQYYAGLPRGTQISHIHGDEWSFGWNAGIAYELNENHRWGFAYRSAVDVKFKGKYSNDLVLPMGDSVLYPQFGNETDGRLTLNLPAVWELSGFHKLNEKLAMQYSWKYTQWSRLQTLDAYSMDGSEQYLHKDEKYRNNTRYALGFSYEVTPSLTLRTGVAYDRSASVAAQSISIPDTNRMWYSAGLSYKITKDITADVGYAYLRGTKTSFDEEGRAYFETKSRANLYGLNLNYTF